MILQLGLSLLTLMATSLTPVHAQATRRLNIQSKVDQYELLLNGNSGSVAGKPADLSTFAELLGMLTNPLTADCPAVKGAPDVTVKENGQTRWIHIGAGLVSDGKHCLHVEGEGLLYFPIHRDFLIGPREDRIAVRSPLKIFRQGVKLFELKKVGDQWQADGTNLLLDWDFLERWQRSLADYKIRFRAQLELANGKPKMIVQIGNESYEFYKITNVTWALKRPGHRWLEASDDWSFWYAFDNGVLEDRFSAQIRAFEATQDKAQKEALLEKFGANYTRNLHDLYRKILLTQNEDPDIKRTVAGRLKMKPTKETALTAAKYLQVGDDEDIKRICGQILKAQNPKGPLYKPTDSSAEKAKAVEYWTQWADKNPAP